MQGDCGKTFPLIKGFLPLHEPVGYKGLPQTEEGMNWTKSMLAMLQWIKKNKWESRIGMISVEPGGDLVIVPAEGKERFIFGRPEGVQEKFSKISEYYKRIKPAVEDGYYGSVNVKYKGQIICRK